MKKIIAVLIAVLMVAFATVPAFAAESPVATTSPEGTTFKYIVIVIPTEGGDGSYDFVTEIDENGEQHIKIEPKPNPGYVFDHWEIDGPYKTDDKLTDPNMDLIITGDVNVTPYYKKPGSSTVETGTVNKDNSSTSPQTGSNDTMAYVIMFLSLAACGGAVVMLVKSNKASK